MMRIVLVNVEPAEILFELEQKNFYTMNISELMNMGNYLLADNYFYTVLFVLHESNFTVNI